MNQPASYLRLIFALFTMLAFGAGQVHAQSGGNETYEQKLTDEHIVDIAMALNELEVFSSNPALTRSTNEDVKKYAQEMTTAHEKALESLKQLGLEPQPNEISQTLRNTSKGVRERLGEAEDTRFDERYMEVQISLHNSALNLLDYTLIPLTENAELRQQLIDMRTNVDTHRQHAWEVYRGLVAESGS